MLLLARTCVSTGPALASAPLFIPVGTIQAKLTVLPYRVPVDVACMYTGLHVLTGFRFVG